MHSPQHIKWKNLRCLLLGVHIRSDAQIDVPHLVHEVIHLRLVRREEVVPNRVVIQAVQRHRPALLVRVHVPRDPVAHVVAAAQHGVPVRRVRGVVVVPAGRAVQPEEGDRGRGLGVGGEDVRGDALGGVAVGEEGVHLGRVGRVEVVGRLLAPCTEERDGGVSTGRH